MNNKLNSELSLMTGRSDSRKSHAVILGRLLLKYRRHFLHCSRPSEIGLRGVLQKGHMSSRARLLDPSMSSNIGLELRRPVRDSLCRFP